MASKNPLSDRPVLVITARPLPDHRIRPDLARALKRLLRQHRLEVVKIEERAAKKPNGDTR